MATITIKDLPDSLHLELKEQAKENDRSLNGESDFLPAPLRGNQANGQESECRGVVGLHRPSPE